MSTEYRFLGTVCLHQFLEAVDADDVAGEDVDVALVAALDVVEDVGEQANQERVVLRDQGLVERAARFSFGRRTANAAGLLTGQLRYGSVQRRIFLRGIGVRQAHHSPGSERE
jgi:hypothetical protein